MGVVRASRDAVSREDLALSGDALATVSHALGGSGSEDLSLAGMLAAVDAFALLALCGMQADEVSFERMKLLNQILQEIWANSLRLSLGHHPPKTFLKISRLT